MYENSFEFSNSLDYIRLTGPKCKGLKYFNGFDENLSTKSTSVIVQDLI